jgi:hypothetical protein
MGANRRLDRVRITAKGRVTIPREIRELTTDDIVVLMAASRESDPYSRSRLRVG